MIARYKEDYINFFSLFISSFLILLSGITALVFIWIPPHSFSQSYTARHLENVLWEWQDTFGDLTPPVSQTATCRPVYWRRGTVVQYYCTSQASTASLDFSLNSLTPYANNSPFTTTSVKLAYVYYYPSYLATASVSSTQSNIPSSSATATLVAATSANFSPSANLAALDSSVAASTLISASAPGASASLAKFASRQEPSDAEPTPVPSQALFQREWSYPITTFYSHAGDLASGRIVSAFPSNTPAPTSIPVHTPTIESTYAGFFTFVIALGLSTTIATLLLVSYNLRVACRLEPVPQAPSSTPELHSALRAAPPFIPLRVLARDTVDNDSILCDPVPPYTEHPQEHIDVEPEQHHDPQPKPDSQETEQEAVIAYSSSVEQASSLKSIIDAYNMMPSYAVFGYWEALSVGFNFLLEMVAFGFVLSWIIRLIRLINQGACLAVTNDTDLVLDMCGSYYGQSTIEWSLPAGAAKPTTTNYGYTLIIVLTMLLIFFLAHLALFITLCRKSVLCVKHGAEPRNRDLSKRLTGRTTLGYYTFMSKVGMHHPDPLSRTSGASRSN